MRPQGDINFSMRRSKIERAVSQQCADAFDVKEISASRTKHHASGLCHCRFWEHHFRDVVMSDATWIPFIEFS